MNRFVSLLLVAFSLAAVSLARPAQAQWVKGLPYFLNGNTQSKQPGTDITAVINGATTGHINITSTPINSSPGYTTGGTYNGSVGVYYVWSGSNPTQSGTLTTTQSYEATGAGNRNSGGNSNAGSASGGFYPGSPNWDNTASSATTKVYFVTGETPPSQQQSGSLGGTVSAYYNSSNPGSTVVTADVTFGPPVTTHD